MSQAITKFPDLRVLAIEDYMLDQEVLEAMFLDLMCDFEFVDNNHDALELHRAKPFDVILMDLLVPDIDKKDAIRIIKSMPGKAGHANIIATTSTSSTPHDAALWRKLGVASCIKKPIKIRELEHLFLTLLCNRKFKNA